MAGILLKFMEHAEEMETRRMQEQAEREERQREQERKHEERMMMMLSGALHQLTSVRGFPPQVHDLFQPGYTSVPQTSSFAHPYYSYPPFPPPNPPNSPPYHFNDSDNEDV